MDQDLANLDLSWSQRAYLHDAVPVGDGHHWAQTSDPIPVFVCFHAGCECSFRTAKLLEAHATLHDKGKQTANAIDNFPIAAGHWSSHELHHGFGYIPPTLHTASSGSLSGTCNDARAGFCDPNHGWLSPFNSIGISGHGYTDAVHNMPPNAFTTVGEGAFTQGFDPSSIASHGPYVYGHSQPTIAASLLTHAVDQMSNTVNDAGPVQTRPVCMQCGRDFGRQSDLHRHMKKHQPGAQVFRCQIQGCQYSSKRKDKLMEHSRRPH